MLYRNNQLLSGGLTINGLLHCKGDLEVKGNVYLKPGSQLVVDGKRTIHGSLKEIKA
jgi:cytoskeletal protein CcmA (bactofilin family)